ncbi:MAG: asparagine synthetase B, partial [Bacteroidia bacterium]|nr:asparagine synthetase B [Bacteroidia bacterium]
MCGIAGGFVFSGENTVKAGLIENAVAALKHRGPDFFSAKTFKSAVLGHARLSIIDTSSSSNQPFTDSSGNFHIVFNGEIFNYKQLRTELEAEGIKFRTNGDVEVLLELYKKYGNNCFEKIKGFFAAGIYNENDHSLFVVRDRFGVKPLYYFADEKRFFFASEIRSLLCFDIDVKADRDSLNQYLQLNYIPGSNSIFSEIKKIPPGHFVQLSGGKMTSGKYYDLHSEISKEKKSVAASPEKHLRNLLQESVNDRL